MPFMSKKVKGDIRCPKCGRGRVKGTLTVRSTKELSVVTYPKHPSASDAATKNCTEGTIRPGDQAYPAWARREVAHLPAR